MLNSVRLKTCVVEGRRDASTVEAERAAFVDRDAGNLIMLISGVSQSLASDRDSHTLLQPQLRNQR